MAFDKQAYMREYSRNYYQIHKDTLCEANRKYYQTHKVEVRKANQKYQHEHANMYRIWRRKNEQKIKYEVFQHYSVEHPACLHCGEDDLDVLTIDHIDDNGAEQRENLGGRTFAGKMFYRWLKKNDYPTGYQVLCANCNLKKETLRRRASRKV